MGSFPSQEQVVHPAAAAPTSDTVTAHQQQQHHHHHHHHHQQQQQQQQQQQLHSRDRTTQSLVKKLTRGRLLFLGLDGAGKSTIVAQLARACDDGSTTHIKSTSFAGESIDELRDAYKYPNASKTFASWSYKLERDYYLQIIDVPGRRAFRQRWYTASLGGSAPGGGSSSGDTQSIYASSLASSALGSQPPLPLLGVVFVVDVSDRVRFPVVAEELVRFQKLKEQKKSLRRAQFFLLLNKTDLMTAAAVETAAASAVPSSTPNSATAATTGQQTDAQQLASIAARRTAMRAARRELKQCIDHYLRVDQRRNPSAYQQSALIAASSASTIVASGHSTMTDASPPGAPMSGASLKASIGSSVSANRSAVAAAAEAAAARSTVMLASIFECCAHDSSSVTGIHAWIKDEIKKAV